MLAADETGNRPPNARIPTIMSYTMASILVHNESVPTAIRAALRAAHEGPPEHRLELLESAAQILQAEIGVGCSEARELVDLPPGDCAD